MSEILKTDQSGSDWGKLEKIPFEGERRARLEARRKKLGEEIQAEIKKESGGLSPEEYLGQIKESLGLDKLGDKGIFAIFGASLLAMKEEELTDEEKELAVEMAAEVDSDDIPENMREEAAPISVLASGINLREVAGVARKMGGETGKKFFEQLGKYQEFETNWIRERVEKETYGSFLTSSMKRAERSLIPAQEVLGMMNGEQRKIVSGYKREAVISGEDTYFLRDDEESRRVAKAIGEIEPDESDESEVFWFEQQQMTGVDLLGEIGRRTVKVVGEKNYETSVSRLDEEFNHRKVGESAHKYLAGMIAREAEAGKVEDAQGVLEKYIDGEGQPTEVLVKKAFEDGALALLEILPKEALEKTLSAEEISALETILTWVGEHGKMVLDEYAAKGEGVGFFDETGLSRKVYKRAFSDGEFFAISESGDLDSDKLTPVERKIVGIYKGLGDGKAQRRGSREYSYLTESTARERLEESSLAKSDLQQLFCDFVVCYQEEIKGVENLEGLGNIPFVLRRMADRGKIEGEMYEAYTLEHIKDLPDKERLRTVCDTFDMMRDVVGYGAAKHEIVRHCLVGKEASLLDEKAWLVQQTIDHIRTGSKDGMSPFEDQSWVEKCSEFSVKNIDKIIDGAEFLNKQSITEFLVQNFSAEELPMSEIVFGVNALVKQLDGKVSREAIFGILPGIASYHHEILFGKELDVDEGFLSACAVFDNITTKDARRRYVDFVGERGLGIDYEKEMLEIVPEMVMRIEHSNALELTNRGSNLLGQLLRSETPEEARTKLDRIEDIFTRNNLPYAAKVFSIYKVIQDGQEFEKKYNPNEVSPVLWQAGEGVRGRDAIIMGDLLQCALDSNNRSMREYLDFIAKTQEKVDGILNGEKGLEDFDAQGQEDVKVYARRLNTLYNQTLRGRENPRELDEGRIEDEVKTLVGLFGAVGGRKIEDMVVRSFAYPLGVMSLEQAMGRMDRAVAETDRRNRERVRGGFQFKLERGDLIKGINDVVYLKDILQNGSLCQEFLGASADSDLTPLDTDLRLVQKDEEKATSGYGKTWVVLKGDGNSPDREGRFQITRVDDEKVLGETAESARLKRGKIELFVTAGSDHMGIRTGFGSKEIDFISTDEDVRRIGYEIAKNGFYIPVVRPDGELIFRSEDYDEMRKKMSGLSYYHAGEYVFAEDRGETERIREVMAELDENQREVAEKKAALERAFSEAFSELGYGIKEHIDGDFGVGDVEILDTGSTGRGTNVRGDSDFDFLVRIDRNAFDDEKKRKEIIAKVCEKLGKEYNDDPRWKAKDGNGVKLPGVEEELDVDISFKTRTNKLEYSTDEALKDRLETIRKQDPERYKEVVANIIVAKEVLKKADAYGKGSKGGGLGGVGVENWILQNGGSFKQAAEEFLAVAATCGSFEEFKKKYSVFDFGENHYRVEDNSKKTENQAFVKEVYDDFVHENMFADGYEKMKEALKTWLKENFS